MQGKSILALLLIGIAGTASAQERSFGLDGAIYQLNKDGTYNRLAADNPDGRISFEITAATQAGRKCAVELTMRNRSSHRVQYLKRCLKLLSNRGGDTVCFNFGGGRENDAVVPGQVATASRNFDRGSCDTIVGAEPYDLFNGRDPSEVNVVGIAPFAARKLFHFSKAGLISIDMGN